MPRIERFGWLKGGADLIPFSKGKRDGVSSLPKQAHGIPRSKADALGSSPPFELGVFDGSYSGAISATLASLFPHDAVALNALGQEAGESRLWAGIHFRSDIDAGLAPGRAVANLVIEQAKSDGSQ